MVVFHGWLGDVNPLLSSMDAVLITSRAEGFSFVVLEAFRTQVPVISLAVGALPFTLQNGNNGFLCNNLEEMVDVIRREILMKGPNVEGKIAKALQFLEEECSLSRMVSRYQQLWQ